MLMLRPTPLQDELSEAAAKEILDAQTAREEEIAK